MYATRVKAMIEEKKTRLVININDLRRKNPTRSGEYVFITLALVFIFPAW